MSTDLNVAKDLVPISQFGEAAKHVHEVVQSRRAKVVTENGVGVAVIVDVATHEALASESGAAALLRDLQAALADADAGNLVDHAEVIGRMQARFAGRVPPELMSQLAAP
jgi:hypothetical protein